MIVILGGEPNVTTLIHFLGPTSQVFTYCSIHDSNDFNLGERYKGKGVPFCKHFHHPGHLCNQPVGRDLHPEEGENWNPLFDCLRLRRQRSLELPHSLSPISLEHSRLFHTLPPQHLPPSPSHLLEQIGPSCHRCLPLHHGVSRRLCTESRRREKGGWRMVSKLLTSQNISQTFLKCWTCKNFPFP